MDRALDAVGDHPSAGALWRTCLGFEDKQVGREGWFMIFALDIVSWPVSTLSVRVLERARCIETIFYPAPGAVCSVPWVSRFSRNSRGGEAYGTSCTKKKTAVRCPLFFVFRK